MHFVTESILSINITFYAQRIFCLKIENAENIQSDRPHPLSEKEG